MKPFGQKFFAGLVFVGVAFGVTACQQAPAPVAAAPAEAAPAPAPAPSPVVVEERRPVIVEDNRPRVVEDRARVGVDLNVHKRDDGGHVSVDLHAR